MNCFWQHLQKMYTSVQVLSHNDILTESALSIPLHFHPEEPLYKSAMLPLKFAAFHHKLNHKLLSKMNPINIYKKQFPTNNLYIHSRPFLNEECPPHSIIH